MWDQQTGRSRGFGFLSFRNQQDAQSAINDLTGNWVGSRQIRCNWVTKGAGTSDEKQTSDVKSVIELTDGSSEEVKETVSSSAPTVYVGNLATEIELHHQFHALGAGSIEEVRVQRDKGFGFVRYSTHAEAAMAIQLGHSESYLCGRQIKCSWGNKLTPAGTSSNLLLPPRVHGLDALAYESQGSTSGSQAIYDCGFQSSNI